MALILILHVLAIGVLLSRLPIRIWSVLGTFAYFFVFYFVSGQYIASHRDKITPKFPLEDDYYNHLRPPRKSPFPSPDSNGKPKDEEEATLEQERRLKEERQNSLRYPSTKP